LAHTVQGFPLPDLVARGQLLKSGQGWSWPFLIYEYLPGMTIGEAWNQLTDSMKLDIAANLGQMIRQLHATPLIPGPYFSPDWAPFIYFLERQRRTCRTRLQDSGCIPDHFLNQINSYLLPIQQLVDPDCSPHLVHADLTRDHLLGYINAGRWRITGLIDFGDARVGNLYYELVALHFDLFQRDKMMLQRFLESYQAEQKILENFPVKAMNMLLLHEFGVEILHDLFINVPELAEFDTLDSLAECLWSVNFRNH
jgi:hygromycin-B 7''-O-kinase